MEIVETKVWTRANVSVPFFKEANPGGVVTSVKNSYQSLVDNGKFTIVTTYPDTTGNLQMREVSTYADFATIGTIDTHRNIALDTAYLTYAEDHQPSDLTTGDQLYSFTGIDDPFYVTTVYTFPTENDSYIPIMTQSLEIAYDHKGKLVDMVVTTNSITLIHQYNNATDYTQHLFNDLRAYVPQLAEKNATRTITYTDGTYTK